jgi:hypothetical protein
MAVALLGGLVAGPATAAGPPIAAGQVKSENGTSQSFAIFNEPERGHATAVLGGGGHVTFDTSECVLADGEGWVAAVGRPIATTGGVPDFPAWLVVLLDNEGTGNPDGRFTFSLAEEDVGFVCGLPAAVVRAIITDEVLDDVVQGDIRVRL